MKFNIYIGCLFCGIPIKKAQHNSCIMDAPISGIEINQYLGSIRPHHWVEVKEVLNWETKGTCNE